MNNSYIILPKYDYNETYSLSDIFQTNKNTVLSDAFLSDNKDAFYYITLRDNMSLEQVSYTQYKRSDYWDLLMKINQMDSPFCLPKSIECVVNNVEADLEKWSAKFPNYPESLLDEKRIEIEDYYTQLNELHRTFRCVKERYIPLLFEVL